MAQLKREDHRQRKTTHKLTDGGYPARTDRTNLTNHHTKVELQVLTAVGTQRPKGL
jgi:hypothetical protein